MVFENSKLNQVLLQQFHKLILLHYQIGIKGFIHSHILIKKCLSKQCCQLSLNNLKTVGNTENKRKKPTQSKNVLYSVTELAYLSLGPKVALLFSLGPSSKTAKILSFVPKQEML